MRYFLCCTVPKCLKRRLLVEKIFEFHAHFQKCHFGHFYQSTKMALLNSCTSSKVPSCMKFKKNFGQKTSFEELGKCHVQKIFITFSRVCQIKVLGQLKYKLRLFFKKNSRDLKILFIKGSYESKPGKQIGSCPFFGCS